MFKKILLTLKKLLTYQDSYNFLIKYYNKRKVIPRLILKYDKLLLEKEKGLFYKKKKVKIKIKPKLYKLKLKFKKKKLFLFRKRKKYIKKFIKFNILINYFYKKFIRKYTFKVIRKKFKKYIKKKKLHKLKQPKKFKKKRTFNKYKFIVKYKIKYKLALNEELDDYTQESFVKIPVFVKNTLSINLKSKKLKKPQVRYTLGYLDNIWGYVRIESINDEKSYRVEFRQITSNKREKKKLTSAILSNVLLIKNNVKKVKFYKKKNYKLISYKKKIKFKLYAKLNRTFLRHKYLNNNFLPILRKRYYFPARDRFSLKRRWKLFKTLRINSFKLFNKIKLKALTNNFKVNNNNKKKFKKTVKTLNNIKKSLFLLIKIKKKQKKINKRQWSFKYLNKVFYTYNKLKKIIKNISHKYYLNTNANINNNKNISNKKIIFDYMYLNKHVVSHYFVKFFKQSVQKRIKAKSYIYREIKNEYLYYKGYKKFKKTTNRLDYYKEIKINRRLKKKVYFFNSWRGVLSSWRSARLIHWKMYKTGTLKTRRYRIFLPPFLKNNNKLYNIIINFFCVKFQFSNLFWKDFTQMYLFFFNKNLSLKQIFQIPLSLIFWMFLNEYRRNKYKIRRKIKSWLHRKIRIKRTFWMNRKRKTPSFFSKQIFKFNIIKSVVQYDYITNYFCILKNLNCIDKINDYLFNNKLLKMHNFKYNS